MAVYPSLPGLSLDGTVYRNDHLGTFEAALPSGGFATAHAPTLQELDNGDLLCAWFAGSFEGSADISIVCSRLPKGARQWEETQVVSRDPERSEQNPSFFLAPNGVIWLVYTAQLARSPGKDNMQFTSIIRRQISVDNGRTWGEAETLFPNAGTFARQPIQVLSNGRWIFSNWLCSDTQVGLAGDPTVFQISDDQGLTWKQVKMPESEGRVHANVIELGEGRLVAFMRSRFADRIYRSASKDYGETWSVPKATELPNNNASISAVKLRSGRIAVVYNPTHAPGAEFGKMVWPGLRCPVNVALSEDGGKTFPLVRTIEPGEGYCGLENSTNNATYEYPFIMQDKAGNIHLAYAFRNRITTKWVCISENDIAGKKREILGRYNPTSADVT